MTALVSTTKAVRRVFAIALLVAMLALSMSASDAPAALAHDTSHCYHGNIYNGGWVSYYGGHFWWGSRHYNVYYHYLYVRYQHTEYNLCN